MPESIERPWRGVSPLFHVAAAAWVGGILALAQLRPDTYAALMQEDRVVEWWTVTLFFAAAAFRGWAAIIARRPGDLVVALFCLFVALEEMSWGQRLLGYTPPAVFLEHNTQQETTLHNFADVFGKPKWILSAVLFAFGVVLPIGTALARSALAARSPVIVRAASLLARLRLTPPSSALIPWFVASVVLLASYPVDFTGEWIEALAGALFFASARPPSATFALASVGTLAAALGLTQLSAVRRAPQDRERLACARIEADALLHDLASEDVKTSRFERGGRVHKRVWTAVEDGYLAWDGVRAFHAAQCAGATPTEMAQRRRFAIDPWGVAYWLYLGPRSAGQRRVTVYSLGPNRRLDDEPDRLSGDDIGSVGLIPIQHQAPRDTAVPYIRR
ncbi:MAG: hypothetical protein ACT4R6_12695 [Gemmatimonadaceae bacterium]